MVVPFFKNRTPSEKVECIKRGLLSSALLVMYFVSFSQGELPVDINTGRPMIGVPLTTISSHEISDNVSLVYNATGVRVQRLWQQEHSPLHLSPLRVRTTLLP
jgi:hypothetical protein